MLNGVQLVEVFSTTALLLDGRSTTLRVVLVQDQRYVSARFFCSYIGNWDDARTLRDGRAEVTQNGRPAKGANDWDDHEGDEKRCSSSRSAYRQSDRTADRISSYESNDPIGT